MNEKYQDFLNILQNANKIELDWLVMKYSLQNLSEALRQAVMAAAIPHWFDQDFLNAVLANPLKDQEFKTLTELSFIEVYPDRGFNVHERSRKLLLDRLWGDNKTRYQKLSKRAAAYCKKQNQNDTAWRVEMLYHSLLANNLTAKESFIKQSAEWHDSFQFEKLEKLTQVIFEAASIGKLAAEVTAWASFWQAEIDIRYSRSGSAIELLQQALIHKTNNYLTANCFRSLGNVYYSLAQLDEARHYCHQALLLFQQNKHRLGEANCIKGLGDVHSHLGEYSQARDLYQQALLIYQQFEDRVGEANCTRVLGKVYFSLAEFDQARDCYLQASLINQQIKNPLGEANSILSLGDLHKHLSEYDQARECYQQALKIYQQVKHRLGEANCICALGNIYGAQQQINLAITTLTQAAQLFEIINNKYGIAQCLEALASIYLRLKHFEPALEAFNRAIEVFPDEVSGYQNRALLFMNINNYEKAMADIKRAETIGTKPAITLLRKAELALWQRHTSQAVEFSQQAFMHNPTNGLIHARLALSLLANDQTHSAYTEMGYAITKIYEKHDFDDLLDDLNKLIKIYVNLTEVDTLRKQILSKVASM
jgi:tetratricopeptide (TPR) repeat protein